MTQQSIITVEDLVYCYPDGTRAVNQVTLEVFPGEFIALIGQNGCGKTTLSKVLNGIFKPTSGTVTVDGLDTTRPKVKKQLVTAIGYVFQNPDHQLFNNNVFDEIAYAPRNIGCAESEVRERVSEAARIAGVRPELFGEHPFFLTKGLRQRVAIASILSLKPKIIIVDEPTTGQDYRQSIEIMEFLQELNRQHGHTIIIITHEMDIVAQYAKRAVVMHQGHMLLDGTVREVFGAREILDQASLKPPSLTALAQAWQAYGIDRGIATPEELYRQWRRRCGYETA